jgi:hypothetical protein
MLFEYILPHRISLRNNKCQYYLINCRSFLWWLILAYRLTGTENCGGELHPTDIMFFVALTEIRKLVRKLLGRASTQADMIYFPSLF